jgi:hypothetical protein
VLAELMVGHYDMKLRQAGRWFQTFQTDPYVQDDLVGVCPSGRAGRNRRLYDEQGRTGVRSSD